MSFTAPDDEATVDGAVELSADASDPDGIDGVVFLVDGDAVGERDTNAPYRVDWDSTGVDDGAHQLTAVARDLTGTETSAEIDIVVKNAPPLPVPDAPAMSDSTTTALGQATDFLHQGPDAIQSGVAEGTIAPTRAAVLRGQVRAPDGEPLPGVRITVAGHPEFGETTSRDNGQLFMAVNGGSLLTVRYEKDGYLSSERQVDVPWQDYVWLDDVVLTPLDPIGTVVDLGGTADEVQVAHSSEVVDADGERTATVMFEPGTSAEMVFANGERSPVEDATVRATEFTVGDAGPERMPGALPSTTAYTYAAEFSLDEALDAGALTVEFSKPVAAYVDNFLEVPVGVSVPTGYYDRRSHAWKPMADGRVVKILSETGAVAQLDVSGDGDASGPGMLEDVGIEEAEQRRLAELYEPGDTLTRLTMTHFTPFDGNFPFRMPGGASGPDSELDDDETDEDCADSGSIIGCENQTLGESIALTGTDFALHYESDRTPASAASRSIRMKLIGDTVHPDLESIIVETRIAGRRVTEKFAATPNRFFRFTWDGKDAFGREVQGTQTARVRVGYQYDVETATAVPYTFADNEVSTLAEEAFNSSWGAMPDPRGNMRTFSGSATDGEGGGAAPSGGGAYTAGWVTLPPTRTPITLWREYQRPIGIWDARADGLGGWTLDAHHAYDPLSRTLHGGDGSTRSADSVNAVISDVDPRIGSSGSARAQEGIEVGPDGTIYFVDYYADKVFKRTPDGQLSLVAGNSPASFSGDGGPATLAGLNGPREVELMPDGSLLIVDYLNHRIRRVAIDGTITTVAGNGSTVLAGDGGPADDASLRYPWDVEAAADGTFYIADRGHGLVRKVEPSGVITTIVGCTDGTVCPQFLGSDMSSIALARDGTLWIAASSLAGYTRLLRKSPDGDLDAVGGYKGAADLDLDGVPLADANLSIESLEFGPDGLMYIVESNRKRVRRLDADGMVRRVAGGGSCDRPPKPRPDGSGTMADVGDDGPAMQACLPLPRDVAFTPDGTMHVSDWSISSLRRVGTGLPGFSDADLVVPSGDGAELYRFDANGRHLKTVDALTGATLLEFGYDTAGRLVAVADGDGNSTEIERGADGRADAIVGPYGARTTLAVRADGWLGAVTDPEAGSHALDYAPGGLLTSFAGPDGHASTFTYEDDGRLRADHSPDGEAKTLARTDIPRGHEVTITTALGSTRSHTIELTDGGATRRRIVQPTGATTEQVRKEGSTTTTHADGTTFAVTQGGDPRWGTQAPVDTSSTLTTPGGLQANVTVKREALLQNASQPTSLINLKETVTANGQSTTGVFDVATRTSTLTSPLQRLVTIQHDAMGRPLSTSIAGLATATNTYDAHGRPSTTTQGDRTWTQSYDGAGNLAAVTGPESFRRDYAYDDAGRLLRTTLPDDREINFAYDAAGRLNSLTPPGRPQHGVVYSNGGKTKVYEPPASAEHTDVAEHYDYDLDGRLAQSSVQAAGRSSTTTTPPAN